MDQLKQFIIQNWEYILSIFGGTGALGIGSYKGAKEIQKARDQSQDKRIRKTEDDILELNMKMEELKKDLNENTLLDTTFRESIAKITAETNAAIKELTKTVNIFITKYYDDRISDLKERR